MTTTMHSSFDDDEWQEMPVVRDLSTSDSSSDDDGVPAGYGAPGSSSARRRRQKSSGHGRKRSVQASGTAGISGMGPGGAQGNATGQALDVDDARGYTWRVSPAEAAARAAAQNRIHDDDDDDDFGKGKKKKAGSDDSDTSEEEDEGASKGYTQLRLDDDVEGEELHAATEYLFGGPAAGSGAGDDGLYEPTAGTGATPLSQLATTKQLLSEGQKIAYVGLVSLVAKELVRRLARVPGKEMQPSITAAEEWCTRVMARLYQHMDIEVSEQNMIESLAHHGVLSTDLAPSLVTTKSVDNPDFDPEAEAERQEELERQRLKAEALRIEEEAAQAAKAEPSSSAADAAPPAEEPPSANTAVEDVTEQVADVALSDDAVPEGDGDLGGGGDDSAGDIGASLDEEDEAPPPPYQRKAQPAGEDDADGGDIGAALDSDDEDGDITSSAATKDVKPEQLGTPVAGKAELSPTTPKASLAALPSETETKAGDASVPEPETNGAPLDPNTAAQLADGGAGQALGLTAAPQAIDTLPSALEGVTTELSSADKHITLDLRWTVLCDLFLVLTADSVYDARSRVLLEEVAAQLGLTWMDVTKFEKRVTDALEIEEGVSGSLRGKKAVRKRAEMARKRRMVMMGLATVGGGIVIGLSAGLLAPVIGAGLGAALGTIGIGGTTTFLGGVGGAAIITSTATAGGMAIGGRGMSRRTRSVRTFEFRPIHNNKRVNCIVTMGGFMNGAQDDPRLPFSVIDSIMGDVFSVLWEPDMMQEMGDAIYLLYSETMIQGLQQVLAATIAGGLVGALAWPLWLTKLGLFIDNPWSNALDRSWSAGLILADVLSRRQLGVRPVTLVGFSLGARSIFYALQELAKNKKFGIVQNVYLIGAPVTATDAQWREARSVVSGRFVNAFSSTDWILGYLFRATTGGLRSIAGLHPVERVPDLENIDVTNTVPGHLQYRAFMPLVLDQLGFRTTADFFDEPEDMANIPEREVVREAQALAEQEERETQLKTVKTKTGGFGKIFRRKGSKDASSSNTSGTASPVPGYQASATAAGGAAGAAGAYEYDEDEDDLPPREASTPPQTAEPEPTSTAAAAAPPPPLKLDVKAVNPAIESARAADNLTAGQAPTPEAERPAFTAVHFDTEAILAELKASGVEVRELESSLPPLVTQARRSEPERPRAQPAAPSAATTRFDAKHAPAAPATPQPQPASDAHSRNSSRSSPPSRPANTPAPYARSFNQTPFGQLPPPAPPALPLDDGMGGVSLSFAENYDDDEDEDVPQPSAPAPPLPAPSFEAAKGYGLSSDAAAELARRFQGGAAAPASTAAAPMPVDDGWGQDAAASSQTSSRASSPPPVKPLAPLPADAPDWSSAELAGGDTSFDSAPSESSIVAPPRSLSFGRLATEDPSDATGTPSFTPLKSSANAWSSGADNPWG